MTPSEWLDILHRGGNFAHFWTPDGRAGASAWFNVNDGDARRDAFRALAKQLRAAFFIVAPQATPAVLRARIRGRLAKGDDPSEATLAVLAKQLSQREPLRADERDCLLQEQHFPRPVAAQLASRQYQGDDGNPDQ